METSGAKNSWDKIQDASSMAFCIFPLVSITYLSHLAWHSDVPCQAGGSLCFPYKALFTLFLAQVMWYINGGSDLQYLGMGLRHSKYTPIKLHGHGYRLVTEKSHPVKKKREGIKTHRILLVQREAYTEGRMHVMDRSWPVPRALFSFLYLKKRWVFIYIHMGFIRKYTYFRGSRTTIGRSAPQGVVLHGPSLAHQTPSKPHPGGSFKSQLVGRRFQ